MLCRKQSLCLLLALLLFLGAFTGCTAETPKDTEADTTGVRDTVGQETVNPSTEPTETEPPILEIDPFENAYCYRSCTKDGQWPEFVYEAWSYFVNAAGETVPIALECDQDIVYQNGDIVHMTLPADMTAEAILEEYGVIFTRTEADIEAGYVNGWASDSTTKYVPRLEYTQENAQMLFNQLEQPGWRENPAEKEERSETDMEQTGYDLFDAVAKNFRIDGKLPAKWERLGAAWTTTCDLVIAYRFTLDDGSILYSTVDPNLFGRITVFGVPYRLEDGTVTMISAYVHFLNPQMTEPCSDINCLVTMYLGKDSFYSDELAALLN